MFIRISFGLCVLFMRDFDYILYSQTFDLVDVGIGLDVIWFVLPLLYSCEPGVARVCVSDLRMPLIWKDTDHFKNKGDYRRLVSLQMCMVLQFP